MKKILIWFLMLGKRQIKKVSLYVVLLVLVTACCLIKYVADNFSVTIEIGIVNEDDGNVANAIEKQLYSHNGLISFVEVSSYEELQEKVRAQKIMGGYVLKEGFSSGILSGQHEEVIEALSTPNSMIAAISNEIFFSFVMKEISYEELVRDTEETGLFMGLTDEDIRSSLRRYYDINISDGSTFSLDYDEKTGENDGQNVTIDIYDYISPVIVGIVGLMIFVGGMCGNISYYDDRENGSLSLLKPWQSQAVSLIETAVPVAVIAVAGVGILALTGMEKDIGAAAFRYGLYSFIVILYCYIQKIVIRKKEVYISFIPVFILMSVVFCPVFINLAAMAPELAVVGKALPLYWLYAI